LPGKLPTTFRFPGRNWVALELFPRARIKLAEKVIARGPSHDYENIVVAVNLRLAFRAISGAGDRRGFSLDDFADCVLLVA
jgi:hypothetical protein